MTAAASQRNEEQSGSIIGSDVAGYRIVAELGSGAMGTVYYGEHPGLGRRAAIKIIHPSMTADANVMSRFFNEARAANAIRHPNIVDITGCGEENGHHYIVMELLEGETLGERIERRQCDYATTVHIAKQMASALAAAHTSGVVHRDLKPENIFLTNHPDYPDYVKVLDFGVAKLLGVGKYGRRTSAGAVIGTPIYMSPEQCLGDLNLDHRSDVYSMGVVLYEMITGSTPFTGDTLGRIIQAHLQAIPVPPSLVRPDMPLLLSDLIMRALEKDPEDRFADMHQLRNALEHCFDPIEKISTKEHVRGEVSIAMQLHRIIMKRIATDRLIIPTMPVVAMRCLKALLDPSTNFTALAALLESDPIVAPQILRRANSAVFGSAKPATTLAQATSRLGMEQLRAALIEASAFKVFQSRNPKIRSSFNGIFEHSLAVATLTRTFARAVGRGDLTNTGYIAGLLHDVGKPVVASLLLEAEKMIDGPVQQDWLEDDTWRDVVDASHREVGVALANKWGLPEDVCMVIRSSDRYDTDDALCCSNLVCFANAIAKREGFCPGETVDGARITPLIAEGKQLLGLSDHDIATAVEGLAERI